MQILLVAALVGTLSNHHHAEAFSLQMNAKKSSSSDGIPPPFRAVASQPPPSTSTLGFQPPPKSVISLRLASTATDVVHASSTSSETKQGTLGLLTFDLDDSLYPIEPVLNDANNAFVQKMAQYGYFINPQDIVEAGKRIRESAGKNGVAMSHTEVRMEAIRSEMERNMLQKKLAECAEDWATDVKDLTAPLKASAEKWAKGAVAESVVESIYSAWERERHHSAERHLYPEIITALQTIREEHPNVVIGAVTDGKANPMLMVFSLAPYFDFCMSWEDDAAGRTEFYKELGNVDGNADLQWIYKAAVEKGKEIADAKKELKKDIDADVNAPPVWVHIGDDLAYDVGGSASCGANTILLDLDEEYNQSAKLRFPPYNNIPAWNTASNNEIAHRKAMNDEAESMVDKRVSRLSMLPDAINEILNNE
mmetsp:Transcript_28787/g.45330  ORF Transcript_28787/g.45330 Transcript_28787/m.45330 type:complete len:423 (-) Transcript_28787:67-1335(-)